MFFRNIFKKYDSWQTSYPIVVKCTTAGILASTADIIAQNANNKDEVINKRRILAFSIFGISWAGLFNHHWYNFLARKFPSKQLIDVCKKTFMQHGLLNPFVYVPTFLFSQPLLLSGGNINNISTRLSPDKFKEDYVSTLRTCYIFWIPLSVIQFVFIPTPYHVLYNSGLGFIWNVLLSTLYYSENKLKNRNINSV